MYLCTYLGNASNDWINSAELPHLLLIDAYEDAKNFYVIFFK